MHGSNKTAWWANILLSRRIATIRGHQPFTCYYTVILVRSYYSDLAIKGDIKQNHILTPISHFKIKDITRILFQRFFFYSPSSSTPINYSRRHFILKCSVQYVPSIFKRTKKQSDALVEMVRTPSTGVIHWKKQKRRGSEIISEEFSRYSPQILLSVDLV